MSLMSECQYHPVGTHHLAVGWANIKEPSFAWLSQERHCGMCVAIRGSQAQNASAHHVQLHAMICANVVQSIILECLPGMYVATSERQCHLIREHHLQILAIECVTEYSQISEDPSAAFHLLYTLAVSAGHVRGHPGSITLV